MQKDQSAYQRTIRYYKDSDNFTRRRCDPNRCADNHVWPRSFRSAGAANRNEATMTPTDAQIEAAAKAAYKNWTEPVQCCEPTWDELPESHKQRLYDCQKAALTAAAEVVEKL